MKAINIVLAKDGNKYPEWHFVEIEDDEGNSINFGKWTSGRNDREFKIRITEQDFKDMEGDK